MEYSGAYESTERAACHEAGHVIVAKSLDIKINCVRVTGGEANTVVYESDFSQKTELDKFTYFAGGIAGEKIVIGSYDAEGMGKDQDNISERGGSPIEKYLPLALDIISSRTPCFNRIRKRLIQELINAGYDENDSFDVLSESDLDQICSDC